ncbi:amidase [Pseudaestuariivita atlantica]|uniref:Amidase n=1 Tax=Pseudaestuariivita atlantica TaxID=1317121 RepID=A0A0L1JP03_9RHOB|nr:amidase family protein [Pseudaestuariivita atlantica]KNG93495.1 amidase [Pseudaestuariivita atlantica]
MDLSRTASDLGRDIAAGRLDPVDLTEAYLAAIDGHADAGRIYARVTADRARAEASAARDRAKAGLRRGLLDGLPVSWKDLVDSAGVATEAGSALLKGRVPAVDGEALRNASMQGLVCLGKTHLSELAFSGLGYNPITATPPNVNDPEAVPGGSSSGAAASVAFGLAASSVGSDTGGSVRIPSAWNDLVGLKTTAGRVSCVGTVALAARFDTLGPLARSVEDAAQMLAAMEAGRVADLAGATLSGVRFAVLETAAFDDIRDAPAAAFDDAVARLGAVGAKITRITVPEVAEALALSGTLFPAEAYGTWKDVIEAAPEKMYPEILARFRGGADVKAADYVAAWQVLDRCRAAYADATAAFDAVLVPTSPILPPKLERLTTDHAYYVTENLLALRNTRIGNLMGLAVLTLPTGTPSCGISLMGAPMGEEKLLRLGVAAERALG